MQDRGAFQKSRKEYEECMNMRLRLNFDREPGPTSWLSTEVNKVLIDVGLRRQAKRKKKKRNQGIKQNRKRQITLRVEKIEKAKKEKCNVNLENKEIGLLKG